MAETLRGNPIVGYYSKANKDFEEHNKIISVSGGSFVVEEDTRPYGFVDLNAKVWFQKFLDDNETEREYLMTEGYLWTGQYPECSRILTNGNNQSMELDKDYVDGTWAKDEKGEYKAFIVNDGVISKFCVLGENYEPCFEGANIGKPQFSLGTEGEAFLAQFAAMVSEVQKILEKGGAQMQDEKILTSEEETAVETAVEVDFKKKSDEEEEKNSNKNAEKEDKEEKSNSDNSDNKSEEPKEEKESEKKDSDSEDKADSDSKSDEDEEDKKKKKTKFSVYEAPEFIELQSAYSLLESENANLKANIETLNSELAELREFRLAADRQEKKAMIDSFYMLSDEDKADVLAKIDTYSLNDIESKLAVICVRKKVSFTDTTDDNNEPLVYSLNGFEDNGSTSIPAWVQAVQNTQKTL